MPSKGGLVFMAILVTYFTVLIVAPTYITIPLMCFISVYYVGNLAFHLKNYIDG